MIDHIADLGPEVGRVPHLGQSREAGQAQEADLDHRVACLVAGRWSSIAMRVLLIEFIPKMFNSLSWDKISNH